MLIYALAGLAATFVQPNSSDFPDLRADLLQPQTVDIEDWATSRGLEPVTESLDQQEHPSPPIPRSNPGYWVTPSDYPSEALRNRWEGITGFELSVDKKGKTVDCRVTRNSDHEVLDRKACESLMARSAFHPATDRKGRAVNGTYSSSVRWEVPGVFKGPFEPPQTSSVRITYTINEDGTVSDCSIHQIGGNQPPFDMCETLGTYFPYRDENGIAIKKRVMTVFKQTVAGFPNESGQPEKDVPQSPPN